MKRIVFCVLALFGASSALAAEDDTYIFDVLARGSYRAAYAKLIKKATVPDWVRDVLRTGDGTATPATTLTIAGKAYRLDHVCKLNDCAGNTLTVLFAPQGYQAWAALIDKGGAPVLLGAPKPEITQALTNAAKP